MNGRSANTSDNSKVGIVKIRFVTDDEPRSIEIRYVDTPARQPVSRPNTLRIQYLDDEFDEPMFVNVRVDDNILVPSR